MTTAPVTVVTGASGGICSALARMLAAAGHRLVLTGHEPAALDELAMEIVSGGGQAAALAGDVRDRQLPGRIVALACERFGRIDNLVNGAGASRPVPFIEIDDNEWDDRVDINLSSVFRMSRAAARQMIAQGEGGAIVHISSIAHANGGANVAYGSAKGGVATLTYGMAQQLGPAGIRVNAVAPGIIDTPMVRGGFAKQFKFGMPLQQCCEVASLANAFIDQELVALWANQMQCSVKQNRVCGTRAFERAFTEIDRGCSDDVTCVLFDGAGQKRIA